MSRRRKVVVIGGGVAGLTAAHELVERDFEVDLFERGLRCGGKAASVEVELGSLGSVPGEHGFRFFPGWYQHLPHTLGRIPKETRRKNAVHKSVLDHLVNVPTNLLATYERDPISVVLHAPQSVDQAQKLMAFLADAQKIGLTMDEARFFFQKLLEFLSIPDEERRQKYDRMSWLDFIEAEHRTAAFKVLASNIRTLVAAKPESASAYTIATMAVRTLFESSLTLDRVLDGPTNRVWIDPWVEHLERLGVRFHLGYELDAVAFDGSGPGIASLRFVPVDDRFAKGTRDAHGKVAGFDDWCRVRAGDDDTKYDTWKENSDPLSVIASSEAKAFPKVEADYYVFSIPIEQMAYYVNRSTMMTFHDETLRNIVRLSASTEWMAGIQYYLRVPFNVEAGHIVCADSEWALTAVEQTQFWRDSQVPREVQSILSVDISQWDRRGRFNKKEAFRCTKREIAQEVWKQLQASFNRDSGRAILQDAMLVTGQLEGSYHLDDNITERYDRAKQAAYNRAQSARLSADALLVQSAATTDPPPFVFGDRLEINVEPLLVNRPGSLALRPGPASNGIPNMFLAADYVNTATNLACMEGANEAARLAVNAILDRAGSKRDRCRTWDFTDRTLLSTLAIVVKAVEDGSAVQMSLRAATSAATTLRSFAARARENLWQLREKK